MNKVKKLIEKFEKHQHKESYLKDLSQTQKINKFSKESQELLADMNNTEIFEFCENSSNQQCLECNTYREIRSNQLKLWKKYEIFAESNNLPAEQLRRQFNPWLRY